MNQVPIRAWREQGIPGGWSIHYEALTNHGQPGKARPLVVELPGQTPHKAVANILEVLTANACDDTEADVWAVALEQWFQRLEANGQANRILDRSGGLTNSLTQRETNIDEFGPHLWAYVHTVFGMVEWDMLGDIKNAFQWTVRSILELLESPAGCGKCAQHFHGFIHTHPVTRIKSREDAAVWWWLAHNHANAQKGVAAWSYARCASKWASVPLTPEQVAAIVERLSD